MKNNNPVDVLLSAPARFTAGEECELQRVLRWLRGHRDMTVDFAIAALEERDHRQTGRPRDPTSTVERRVDILNVLQRDQPLCCDSEDIARELELDRDEREGLRDDLRALEGAGLICQGTAPETWFIDEDTDGVAHRIGVAVLAASTLPPVEPTPGPWRVNDAEGYVYADAGDDEESRKHVEVGYLGRCVAESIAVPGDRALISAAPDLLAACEAMNAALDGHPMKPHALNVLMQMRAAVAKARGQ